MERRITHPVHFIWKKQEGRFISKKGFVLVPDWWKSQGKGNVRLRENSLKKRKTLRMVTEYSKILLTRISLMNIDKKILNKMQNINRSKEKKPYDPLKRFRKSLWQIPKAFHNKSSEELRIQEMFLNIIKARANIILNGEQMKPFLLKSGWDRAAHFLYSYSL
jgi:predicted unusual protein kinase regulating ubiquinone biosynthesis (AarF/ABC1/UbiB family)